MSAIKVAVVDDDDMVSDMLVRILKRMGAEADVFAEAEVALDHILTNRDLYQIIFCDFHLPVLSGPDMLQRLSKEGIQCRSFLMTGGGDDVDETNEAYADFCEGVLAKPFDFGEIQAIIES